MRTSWCECAAARKPRFEPGDFQDVDLVPIINFVYNRLNPERRIYASVKCVMIGSGNDLSAFCAKPLPEPMPTYYQLDQQTPGDPKIQAKTPSKPLKKTEMKHRLRNGGHAIQCITLQWRHNGRDSVSNHQPHDCLLNRFIQTQIKGNIKAPLHWPLCGEFTGDRWIPSTNG